MTEAQSTPTPAAPAAPSQTTETTGSTEQSQDISTEDLQSLSGEAAPEAQAVKDAQDKVESAETPKAKEAAKKALDAAKRKYSLKVDGEEIEWEGTEEDVKRELQLARKARKEIQSSSELKKEVAAFVEMLKNNPKAILSDPNVGIDVIEFAKQVLNDQIEEELKSPEQRDRERLEQELEQLRTAQKDAEEKRKSEEYKRLVFEAEKDVEERVIDALESSGLPKSGYTLRKMADIMLSSMENGKEITAKQAANIAKREMHRDVKELMASSNEDLLEDLIGSDNIKRLNKRQLAKIRAKTIENANSIKEVVRPKQDRDSNQTEKKVKISDWLSNRKG